MSEVVIKRGPGRPRKVMAEQQITTSRQPDDMIFQEPAAPVKVYSNTLRVHIYPHFEGEDKGDGGIRRVVEAQKKHLPAFGIEVVEDPEEADVIAYHATIPSTYIKRFPRKPFVAMCHGLYWAEYEWDNWAKQANTDVMEGLRVADAITAPSEWVANNIRRHTSRPVEVVYHGVDLEDWPFIPESDKSNYVLWNKTRPDPVCDPEALDKLSELLPRIAFVTTFGKARPNVQITGKLPYDKAKKLVQHAALYLCTTRETFGIGTIEAMCSGVPVIGFNFGGQSEFIKSTEEGFLYTPGDVQSIASIIPSLIGDNTLRQKSRAAGKKFTWDKACEAYSKIFNSVYKQKLEEEKQIRTSIIVTNYNLHKYLPAALKSVQDQTDSNWECIVVDDASPNQTGREIVQAISEVDPRFKLVVNQENQYLAQARNTGITASKGRYILPLDADDMLAPEAVQILADALDNDRSIDVAYGNVLFVNEDGITHTDFSEFYKGTGIEVQSGHSTWPFQFSFEQQIKKQNLLPYSSVFRRRAWSYVGGYRSRQRTAEDAELWTRLSSFGFRPRMVSTADTLIYRNRPDSMSQKQGETDWTRWFTWAKLPKLTPAGAGTKEQLPIPSLDPIIISVVIPVGPGHERFVLDAIDSVMSQTFQNWECIVVNDTGKPLENIPPWVKIVDWKVDQPSGAAAARNRGIAASKGRLFLPLDADDYLEPYALEAMLDAHKLEGDVIYSDFWQEIEKGKTTKHECDDYDPTLLTGRKRNHNGDFRVGMVHTVVALTPKSHWEAVGGYDENLPAWEDWDFQLALADKGFCSRRIAAPLFTYRKYTGFRRESNFADFEKSKEGILTKWNKLWEGGQRLMACGSCGMKRTVGLPSGSRMNAAPIRPDNAEATIIRCIGKHSGSMSYRGASKTIYFFAAGDEKYVLAQDIEIFLRYPDQFEIVRPKEEKQEVDIIKEPILVAEGSPS